MEIISDKAGCKVSSCSCSTVVLLAGQDFCLDHFLACCYDRLETLETLRSSRSLDSAQRVAARKFLAECSDRAVHVCLREEHLSNLERSRLLDILLLSGELQMQMRNTTLKPTDALPDIASVLFWKISRQA